MNANTGTDRRVVQIGRDGAAGAPGERGAVVLGGPTRIIAPIMGSEPEKLGEEIAALPGHPVDLVEWRVDPLLAALAPGADAAAEIERAWEGALSRSPLPVLATIRTAEEGGPVALNVGEYAELVAKLAGLADAVDIEIEKEGAEALVAGAHARGAVVVASRHDFSATPTTEAILGVLARMDAAGADVLKIACRVNSAEDTARLLTLQARARAEFAKPLIVIGMGAHGALTRFAGAAMGSAATFATVGAASAPGQFTAEETRMVLDFVERG